MKEIKLNATVENIPVLISFVESIAEELACSTKTVMQLNVAIDEIFSNIAHYAYPNEIGEVLVTVDVVSEPSRLRITFKDSGIQYNPLEKDDPDVTLSAIEREIGGLGILIVKKSMDKVDYTYENNCNILTIEKNI